MDQKQNNKQKKEMPKISIFDKRSQNRFQPNSGTGGFNKNQQVSANIPQPRISQHKGG